MHKQLEAAGVDSTLILDAAMGYIMEQVDLVMLGAEGVTESGGIINKVGLSYFPYPLVSSEVLLAMLITSYNPSSMVSMTLYTLEISR